MFQNKRMNGFHGSTCLVWRSAVRVTSQIYRDSNQEETRNSELLGSLYPGAARLATSRWFWMAFHGDSDATHGIFKSRQFLNLGSPKPRPPLGQAHPLPPTV